MIVVSFLLLAVLQVLLLQSQRNDGVIFASNINALPVREYLPVLLSTNNYCGRLWISMELDRHRRPEN